VGALTGKPIAYTARPWEYEESSSLDLTDSFGTNILINTRGTMILRIIPRINKYMNNYIITDKIRFSFDAINMQRVLTSTLFCYSNLVKKKIMINLAVVELLSVLHYIFNIITNIVILIGNFTATHLIPTIYNTISTLFPTKTFFFSIRESMNARSAIWSNLLYPAAINNLQEYALVLNMNCNLRSDFPIVYYKLQQLTTAAYAPRIIIFGTNLGINFAHDYISNTFHYVHKFLLGNAKLIKEYTTKKVLVILGSQLLHDITLLNSYVRGLQQQGILFNILGTWQHPTAIAQQLFTWISPTILTYYFINKINEFTWDLLISINETVLYTKTKQRIGLYIGSHAPKNVKQYDILIPIRHYYETTGHFFNFQGLNQTANRVIDNPELLLNITDIIYLTTRSFYNIYQKK
jgi:NADH dehydrogenase (ubiquinone) Fe-S protein 1